MVKSVSTYLIVRGVLALIVGIVAVAWPGVTVYALVVLFAVYAFIDAVVQAVRAFSGVRVGAANGRILIALVDVAAGVVAIAYPLRPIHLSILRWFTIGVPAFFPPNAEDVP